LSRNVANIIEMYSRQVIVKEVGVKGLIKLLKSRVAIIGCGATGSTAAELLVRAGIGFVRIIDRDFVEVSNIPRTHILTERDAVDVLPKAVACARGLREISSLVKVEHVVADVNSSNVENLIKDVDLIVDGSDNFSVRYLINDAAVKYRKPWVFIGVERWYGSVMLIIPGKTPCLRCVMPRPPPEVGDVCNILGVINTVVSMTVSAAVTEVLKYFLGLDAGGELIVIDGLRLSINKVRILRNPKCPTCVLGRFEFLDNRELRRARRICGSNAVQVYPLDDIELDTSALPNISLSNSEVLLSTPYVAKLKVKDYEVILFRDGRAIINGLSDEELAIKIYDDLVSRLKHYIMKPHNFKTLGKLVSRSSGGESNTFRD